jgi:hypothetical protein
MDKKSNNSNWEIRPSKSDTIDLMYINHFAIYTFIGYIYPNKYVLPLSLSVLWELFEIFLVSYTPIYNKVVNYWVVPEKYWNEHKLHKIFDIIINFSGYFTGSHLEKYKTKKLDLIVPTICISIILTIIVITNLMGLLE